MTKILSDAPPSATYYSLVIYKLSMVNLCFQKRCPLSRKYESSSSLHNDHFITVRGWKLTAIGFVVPNAGPQKRSIIIIAATLNLNYSDSIDEVCPRMSQAGPRFALKDDAYLSASSGSYPRYLIKPTNLYVFSFSVPVRVHTAL